MWKFWKKPEAREQEIAEQLKTEAFRLVSALTPQWLRYQDLVPFAPSVPLHARVPGFTLVFKEGVPLSTRIASFILPAREGVANNFPAYRDAPMELMLSMVSVAVMEGGTDPILVDEAMKELKTRGGGR